MCSYLACYKRAVRRKKLRTSEFREVKSRRDWDALKSDVASGTKVERVYVNPDESELIRDRDFVAELANHAREHHYVVELSGGLLSHAFYMLGKYGCDVECIDLRSEEHTSELQSLMRSSSAVSCLNTPKLKTSSPAYPRSQFAHKYCR